MSVSNSSDSLASCGSWEVVVEPIAEADPAEPSSTSGGSEAEVAAVARRLSAVSLSRVPSADSVQSADSGPSVASEPVPCSHVDFVDYRFYAVWHIPGRQTSGIYWGGRPLVWHGWHPTWTFLERLITGGRYPRSGDCLRGYPSLDEAIIGYQREALRHGVPFDPIVIRTPCPLCGQ